MGRIALSARLVAITAAAATPPASAHPPLAPKLCGACGAVNSPGATRCASCGRARFAPPWVRALRQVDRGFAVQANDPHEKSEATEPTLTFYKWWLGGHSVFHIRSHEQWERVKQIVDNELLASLGWTSRQEALAALTGEGIDAKAILAENPGLLFEIVAALGEGALGEQEPAALGESRERIAALAVEVDQAQRVALRRSLEQLSAARTAGSRQLAELSEQLAHAERVAAVAELRRRVGVLELLAERLRDERSYKIVNRRSAIHGLLEEAIWILDERCWLSARTRVLRAVLDRAASGRDRPYAKKPPDFACAVGEGRLLVVSICPPSLEPGVADLERLERHAAACHQIEPLARCEATLVGERIPAWLRATLERREDSFQAKTYEELVDAPLRRYRSRLAVLSRLGGAGPQALIQPPESGDP